MQSRIASFSAPLSPVFIAMMIALLSSCFVTQAWGQCTGCSTITNPDKSATFNVGSNQTITIDSNVNFEGTINVLGSNSTVIVLGSVTKGGRIIVSGNNTLIRNEGTISNGTNGGGAGGYLTVQSGYTGTVLTNLGLISSENVALASPTTIANGSAGNSTAVWSGYVGSNFTAVVTINNYGSWSGQINKLASSTINNFSTGRWSAYLTPIGTTVINNSGTWNATDLNYSGSLILNHSGGTWRANLNPGGALALTNSATWTKGFNFPVVGPNSFTNTGTATFDAYLGLGSATTITNSGSMTMSNGMGDISANSSLTNQRNATFQVVGQLVNYGVVSNAGVVSSTGDFQNKAGASMTGPAAPLRGSFQAGGYSANAGSFGMVGRLDFCDAGNVAGFDSQTGSMNAANVTFCSNRPLPVELAAFVGEVLKGQVQLRWTTASEQNSALFVVERSAQGEVYERVSEVAAQGNSTAVTVYAATDAKPLAGTSYYRLRQVDRDGAVAYSPVVKVNVAAGSQPMLAYPTPATDRLRLDLTAATAEPCAVRLLTLPGQAVRAEVLPGGAVQELSLAGLPAGLYLLQVRTAAGSTVQRIEKQ